MLDIFQKLVNNSSKFKRIKKYIDEYNEFNLVGLTNSAKIFYSASIINMVSRSVLVLAPDVATALRYVWDIESLSSKSVAYLPSQEASPYELVYSDVSVLKQQISVLTSFESGGLDVIVTTPKTLLTTYLAKEILEKNSVFLKLNQSYELQEVVKKLVTLGYKRTSVVLEPGEFSMRGDILDIFPVSENPVRIEFFMDEVEKIKVIDVESQRSVKNISEILIYPRYKVVVDSESKSSFAEKICKIKNQAKETLSDFALETLNITTENIISQFETEHYFEGIEYFAPVLNEKLDDLTDYLPKNTLVIRHESSEFLHRLQMQDEKYLKDYEKNIAEGLYVPLPSLLHKKPDELMAKLSKYKTINLDSFIDQDENIFEETECTFVPKFLADLEKAVTYIADLRAKNYFVFLVTEYPQRVEEVLTYLECPYLHLDNADNFNFDSYSKSREIVILRQGFSEGFVIPELNIAVITDAELFNKKIKKPTISKKVSKRENLDFLVSVNDLNPDDFVVHAKHGIGKFIGMTKQSIDGQEKDYLTIEYANTDKLHMPAEQINFLSRYRGAGAPSKLSKMGGVEWDNVKKKVKKSISDIAQDLLNLYAMRTKLSGFTFDADSPWQYEMEEAFPYTETPDQLSAIQETKADMESEKPMDRLICGDVGFGKTEVAIRAVFKAILSGKQAAVLAPTTILAQQHYLNFIERFKPYPVKIELLSRFRTSKEQKATAKNITTGECDLVIGTHRLFQKDVDFKNMGLLVIDEEHKFGVSHKEKLKQMRAEIDVLTLSATPIPRTLYMSLSGVRDMSLINTPPVNRAPVKTYVGEYSSNLIRTAINHELEREGQVYFIHNRVQSIYKCAQDLQELLPEARIAVGHGQMPEKELEKVMLDFSNHEFDILVCTTIVESGLDIPNVNTIIVDNADRFGLAQLYQLRGRVGRSDRQAYAYCFYRQDKILTDEAKDRLKAIKDFTTLGSGYQIALRDLEIRGIGNVLGSQQHGHMISVGFDLYCSLLDEAVSELQGIDVKKNEPAVIDINITAFIPDGWVGDKDQKMIEYKRLADVQSLKELDIIQDEWIDRFGECPISVKHLIQLIKIRLLATDIGVSLVRETDDYIRIFTNYDILELKKYEACISDKIMKKLKFIKAPITSQNAQSIMLLKTSGLLGEEQLKILEELFSEISKKK